MDPDGGCECRNGLIVGTYLTQADGYAERDAALLMAHQKRRASSKPMTLAADKAYDTHDFVGELRELKITPHVHKMIAIAGAPSMGEPRATRAIRSARPSATGSRNRLAG